MTKWDSESLDAPHTRRELGADKDVAQEPPSAGRILSFDPGFLRVNMDGSGYFCVPDAEMVFEDDRQEGPDGPEGSVHWIAKMDASEIVALRDFLNLVNPVSCLSCDNWLADKIEDMIAEFGSDPVTALTCIAEWLQLRRHYLAHPATPAPVEAGLREAMIFAVEALPRRVEPLGGQMTSYVQLGEAVSALRAQSAPVDQADRIEALEAEVAHLRGLEASTYAASKAVHDDLQARLTGMTSVAQRLCAALQIHKGVNGWGAMEDEAIAEYAKLVEGK